MAFFCNKQTLKEPRLSLYKTKDLALASMARDDPPASTTAASSSTAYSAVKWNRNLKPKLAIMRQCTSVTDRRTLTS